MSALRMEKELADSSISLTKNILASRGATAFDIPRMVTGLVTVNGNSLAARSLERKTMMAEPHAHGHAQHNRENPKT